MNEIIEINPERLTYLLELFGLSKEDFVLKLNKGRKRLLTEESVFGETLKLSVLRRIDKHFEQGLSYYTNPVNFPKDEKESIFFRKKLFSTELNFADRLKVLQIENERDHLEVLAVLSNYPKFTRDTELKFSIDFGAEKAAKEVREKLYPKKHFSNQKDFLKELINKLAEYDILVFEYTEAPKKIDKTTIDGFFISPNVIAIKRQQQSFAREIFTLAHELAHYLLDIEELDKLFFKPKDELTVEHWCNAFAFAFLVPEASRDLLYQEKNPEIDNKIIEELGKKHHISRLAIFTHLALEGRIAWQRQAEVKEELVIRYKKLKEKQRKERERERQLAEDQGKEFFILGAKPIHSELEKEIYRAAYLGEVIDEYEVLNKFSIRDIDRFVDG